MPEDYLSLPLPALWAAAVGLVLPVLLAVVNRRDWQPGTKAGVMLAAVGVSTVVTMLITGVFVPEDVRSWRAWLSSALVCFLTTTAVYRSVYKPSGVTDRIEAATSPAPKRALLEAEGGSDV